jgi:indolepyruvate decarboxylase
MAMTLRWFLFDQLWARGVRHIVGIPGDFVLNLYEALERDGRFSLVRLAERLGVPVASSFLGRGVFPTRHLQLAGTYLGVVSPQPLRDTSLGISAQRLAEANLIVCDAREVFVGHHRYQDTPLEQIVTGLLESPALAPWPAPAPAVPIAVSADAEPRSPDSARMTAARVIETAHEFVEARPELPLVSDTGDCRFAAVEIQSNDCVAPAYYATMGCAVPAALGPQVLLNNNRWEMLQAFYPHAGYHDTVAWPFAKLAERWGGRGVLAPTMGHFRAALRDAWVEPPVLSRFVAAFIERVYR